MDKIMLVCAVGIILSYMLIPGCVSVNCTANPNHTRCLTDVGADVPVDKKMRRNIVRKHDTERKLVNATDMRKIKWDKELAKTASKWARQCHFGHDKDYHRTEDTLPGVTVGQNVAVNADMLYSVDLWIKEKEDFVYGSWTGKMVTHYTQVVLASSAKVGCGMANCTGQKYSKVFVCNYAPGFNKPVHPYTQGESCSSCPSRCREEKFCACKKICLNGGTLDLATCRCKCTSLYTGKTCKTITCPDKDQSFCNYWFKPYITSKARKSLCGYLNVPSDCPYECKKCPSDETA